jgi:hypothetical protein
MKKGLIIACMSLFCAGSLFADDREIVVAHVESIEQGKVLNLEWSAPASKISSVPAWNLDAGKFPLSVDDAIKSARTQLTKAFPTVKGWKLGNIALKEIKNNGNSIPIINGKYYYLVYLIPASDVEAQQIEASETGELSFYEVILQDGTVLKPHRKIGNN